MAIYRGPGGSGDATTDANNEATVAANAAQEAEQSAAEAQGYANSASTSAINAANSATSAGTSAASATLSATSATNSASTASIAATTATNAATDAAASAASALSSANSASSSAASASTSASNASSSATSASNSASTATTKASEAANSATNAQTSATNAASSATAAAGSASSASTSATNAANSATSSANSASAAATSATNASNSASSASTSATNAANSASSASTSASNASSSASAAATSASNAATSESNTASLYDQFDDRYLGSKSSDPSVDNDGNALLEGALYWNSVGKVTRIYNGTTWQDVASGGSGGGGTVTSVGLSAPTGFSVSGSPVTGIGTLALSFSSGYSLPTNSSQSNWDTAYSWGNHASAGYLTSSAIGSTVQGYDADLQAIGALSGTSGLLRKTAANTWSLDTNTYLTSYTETDPIYTASSWYSTTNNSSNWNTAYSWGNHATAGYLTSESDTLNSVTGRGNTTANSISIGGLTNSGNLTFTGTGNRITGDFDNATLANRVAFQTSTTNGVTTITAIPNGTSVQSRLDLYNNSDPTNAARIQLQINSGAATFRSEITGTGTYLPMTFQTGGSERMRIDTSGNVGIGTSSPGTPLDVYTSGATAQIRALNASVTQAVGYCSLTAAFSGTFTNHPYVILTNNTEKMRIDTSGNVGIGTTSPQSKFHVLGVTRLNPVTNTNLLIDSGGISSSVRLLAINDALSTQNDITIQATNFYFSNGGTERMRIDSSGNVGIGTSSPSALLDVNGNLAITGSARRITGDFSNGTISNRVLFQSNVTNGITSVAYMPNGTATDTYQVLYSGTDPTNTSGLLLRASATEGQINAFKTGTGTYLPITFYTGGSERMRIDTSGNVGIGTSSPTSGYKLDVAGNFKISGSFDENVYAVVDAAGVAISPQNGTIQTWTLGASRTPTAGTWNAGESLTLMINDGTAYTVTWTTIGVTWVGGTAPTLATTGFTVIELWKVGTKIYGALVGSVA